MRSQGNSANKFSDGSQGTCLRHGQGSCSYRFELVTSLAPLPNDDTQKQIVISAKILS